MGIFSWVDKEFEKIKTGGLSGATSSSSLGGSKTSGGGGGGGGKKVTKTYTSQPSGYYVVDPTTGAGYSTIDPTPYMQKGFLVFPASQREEAIKTSVTISGSVGGGGRGGVRTAQNVGKTIEAVQTFGKVTSPISKLGEVFHYGGRSIYHQVKGKPFLPAVKSFFVGVWSPEVSGRAIKERERMIISDLQNRARLIEEKATYLEKRGAELERERKALESAIEIHKASGLLPPFHKIEQFNIKVEQFEKEVKEYEKLVSGYESMRRALIPSKGELIAGFAGRTAGWTAVGVLGGFVAGATGVTSAIAKSTSSFLTKTFGAPAVGPITKIGGTALTAGFIGVGGYTGAKTFKEYGYDWKLGAVVGGAGAALEIGGFVAGVRAGEKFIAMKEMQWYKTHQPRSYILPEDVKIKEVYKVGRGKLAFTQETRFKVMEEVPILRERGLGKFIKPTQKWSYTVKATETEFVVRPIEGQKFSGFVFRTGKGYRGFSIGRAYPTTFTPATEYKPGAEIRTYLIGQEFFFTPKKGGRVFGLVSTKITTGQGIIEEMGIRNIHPEAFTREFGYMSGKISPRAKTGLMRVGELEFPVKGVKPAKFEIGKFEKFVTTPKTAGLLTEEFKIYGITKTHGKIGIAEYWGKKPQMVFEIGKPSDFFFKGRPSGGVAKGRIISFADLLQKPLQVGIPKPIIVPKPTPTTQITRIQTKIYVYSPATVLTKTKTIEKMPTVGGEIQRISQISTHLEKYIPKTLIIPKEIVTEKPDQRLKTGISSKYIEKVIPRIMPKPIEVMPPIPSPVPPIKGKGRFIPPPSIPANFPTIPFFFRRPPVIKMPTTFQLSKMFGRGFKYQPQLTAIIFNIRAPKVPKTYWTGLTFRPIV